MLIFQITKTNTPLPQKGLAPILIAPPHTYVRNPGNREETKQPLCPIAGLPAPWVLSSAGKLIRYLHGSDFLPYCNTVSTPDASGYRTHYNQWCCLHWMGHDKSMTVTAAVFYLWRIDTNFKWFSAVALSRPVCALETRRASLHRICAVSHVCIAWQCVLPPAVFSLDMLSFLLFGMQYN